MHVGQPEYCEASTEHHLKIDAIFVGQKIFQAELRGCPDANLYNFRQIFNSILRKFVSTIFYP